MFGVPYVWSRMAYRRNADRVEYRASRRWPGAGPSCRAVLQIGGRVRPTDLEVWLTARWGLHTRLAGRTWWVPNEHGAWPLFDARLLSLDDEFVSAAGVPTAGDMLRPLFSPGVRTRFGLPRAL
jgi:uncharacterized protein YqjF (DUF2071 family)